MTGEAVEALGYLRRARTIDPEKPDVWAQMGEVYTHLLPDEGVLDSLAEDAFVEAHQLDSGLAAPLFHLIEIALRRGDVARARELRPLLRDAGGDWELETQVEVMAECVERGPGGVDWRNAVRETPAAVTQVARMLAGGAAHLPCAEAGWRALLRYDTTTGGTGVERRWVSHALHCANPRRPDPAPRIRPSTRPASPAPSLLRHPPATAAVAWRVPRRPDAGQSR